MLHSPDHIVHEYPEFPFPYSMLLHTLLPSDMHLFRHYLRDMYSPTFFEVPPFSHVDISALRDKYADNKRSNSYKIDSEDLFGFLNKSTSSSTFKVYLTSGLSVLTFLKTN